MNESPPELSAYHQNLIASAFWESAARPRFRGEIYDVEKPVTLSSSHKVPAGNVCSVCRAKGIPDCRHFEIETIKQLAGPFRAIRDPNVRKVMLLAAVQTGKSLLYEICLIWLILVSEYLNIIVYLDADEKVKDFCKSRMMPLLKSIPAIARLLPTGADRHDDSDTSIIFTNGKVLHVRPLNARATSSLSWEVVIVDEGWLHGSDGMIQRAIDRAKQVKNRKIIIVGQAGNRDEDQDKVWRGLNRHVPLTFACPCCGGRQEFNLTKERPADFVPLPQKEMFGRKAALPPAPGSYWGLKVQKRFSDIKTELEIREVAAGTVFDCYHCGFEIPDTPEMRARMMATYEQDYQSEHAGIKYTPENFEVGFWNPDPASVTIPFAQTMQEYITARIAKDRHADILPLREFYKNRWATAWEEGLIARATPLITSSQHVTGKIPNERARVMFVDCQQDDALTAVTGKSTMGHYWYVARAIDAEGNMVQLARGYAVNDAEWRAVQKRLEITNDNVGIDGGNWRTDVIDLAARHIGKFILRRKKHGKWRDEPIWLTYKVFVGTDSGPWKWFDGRYRSVQESRPEFRNVTLDGQSLSVKIDVHNHSNLLIKDQLARIMAGGAGYGRFESLKSEHLDEATRLREQGEYTYENQMNSEYPDESKKKRIWLKSRSSAQNHYWDCERGCLILFGLGGHLGIAAPVSATEETV